MEREKFDSVLPDEFQPKILNKIRTFKTCFKHFKRKRSNKLICKMSFQVINNKSVEVKNEPSEYVKSMRELWLPPDVKTVRYSASRQVIGYVKQGGFSFSEARNCGISYVAYNALSAVLRSGHNKVLVRNISSRKYRLADIDIIKSV